MKCDVIHKYLKLILLRIIVVPIFISLAPMMLLIMGNSCKESWEEYKNFLSFIWKGNL